MLRFIILGSGSAGNCAVVCTGSHRVLVDAGLSAAQIIARLHAAGIDPASLDAVLLSHEHGDHTRGLGVFIRKHDVPVFCTSMTREILRGSLHDSARWRVIGGSGFSIGALEVDAFAVPHDAVEPVGFVFRHAGRALGMVSDAGHVTTLMRSRLQGLDALFVEANYCPDLLAADTKRPWSTRQRIAGRHGHLSNVQTAELVAEIATPRLQRIVLGHLSQDCNRPAVALASVQTALEKCQAAHVAVHCAGQNSVTGWFEISARPELPAGPAETAAVPGAFRAVNASPQDATCRWSQMELFS